MKQKQLAEKLGTTQANVSLILSGKRGVSLEIAKRLKKHFGKDLEFWMLSNCHRIKEAIEGNGNNN